jgi:hypothetical protein
MRSSSAPIEPMFKYCPSSAGAGVLTTCIPVSDSSWSWPSSLTTTPSTAGPTRSSTSLPSSSPIGGESSSHSHHVGEIVGAVLGSVLGSLLLLFLRSQSRVHTPAPTEHGAEGCRSSFPKSLARVSPSSSLDCQEPPVTVKPESLTLFSLVSLLTDVEPFSCHSSWPSVDHGCAR